MKNNPEIWAKYIHLLIADEELCRQMGNNGYWKLMTQYNIDKQIDELEKLYMKVATKKCNRT